MITRGHRLEAVTTSPSICTPSFLKPRSAMTLGSPTPVPSPPSSLSTRMTSCQFYIRHILPHPGSTDIVPRSGELRTQKLKSNLVRTQSVNVLSLKPGVGQYTAIYVTLTARNFFLAYFYPSGPFICIFPKPLQIFPCVGCA